MKCVILVNQSITTKIVLNKFDGRRSIMKSMEIDGHDCLRTGMG